MRKPLACPLCEAGGRPLRNTARAPVFCACSSRHKPRQKSEVPYCPESPQHADRKADAQMPRHVRPEAYEASNLGQDRSDAGCICAKALRLRGSKVVDSHLVTNCARTLFLTLPKHGASGFIGFPKDRSRSWRSKDVRLKCKHKAEQADGQGF